MPTPLHPQAKFDPIPPDLDLASLVDQAPNIKWAQRVSRAQIRNLGPEEFEKLVQIHVITGGKPLVIDGWDELLPTWLFSAEWLEKTHDKRQENVRDIPAATDIPMTTGHYLRSMKQLANQWSPENFRDERRQRLYLKDIDCPLEWREALRKIIHPSLYYLNENVTAAGPDDITEDGSLASISSNSIFAPAGDLMSSLPKEMRAENMMCYIGHEGTYTPAHREMCASVGHNIMVETSGSQPGEQPGSSIWFMTESKDREVVREYFLSMLGHEIEIEKHFAQINAWKKAPFDVYMVEQRVGDFIIIPPLAAHQVWNRGTRTMKVAWNRTTAETLGFALHEALPKARLVCRDEQYKNKAIIFYTLEKYSQAVVAMEAQQKITETTFSSLGQGIVRNSPRVRQLASDFKTLFNLFTEVLVDESFGHKEKIVEFLPYDSCVTCSYCRSNIFNRFLTCKHCTRTLLDGSEDAYDVCMECYAMGRSCACLSGLQWCEQWKWSILMAKYEDWRELILVSDGFIDVETSPPPFEVARLKAEKKSVAQICQEALLRRPWRDITKPDIGDEPTDSEEDRLESSSPKKNRRKKKKGELRRCHVCCHKDYSYRVQQCANPGCSESYCYGVLYRAFDMMPQSVQQQEYWQCPKCLGICNCGYCRRLGNTNGYMPKNTSLGHDTRPIADDRSVEALVDFRVHNLSWLKAAGEESRSKDSKRMQRLRELADDAKARVRAEDQDDNASGREDTSTATPVANGHTFGDVPAGHGIDSNDSMFRTGGALIATSDSRDGHLPTEYQEAGAGAYPDPSIFAGHCIGMGYYERDDAPDRILFDAYQAPSAPMQLDEPDVPEAVRKAIRAAKRKAKKEKEDPEFIVGSRHHKKPRLVDQNAMHQTLDPALFMAPSPTAPSHRQQQPVDPGKGGSPMSPNSQSKKQSVPGNDLTLRHAKPISSYVELDELDLGQADSGFPESPQDKPGTDSVLDTEQSERQSTASRGRGNVRTRGRRGRPPGRPPGSQSTHVNRHEEQSGSSARNGSGRISHSATRHTRSAGETANEGQSALFRSRSTSPVSKGESQGPRDGPGERQTPAMVGSLRGRDELAAIRTTKANKSDMENRRPRGRPPKAAKDRVDSKPKPESKLDTTNYQFMSMAERMALRGKKFKITKRQNSRHVKTMDGESSSPARKYKSRSEKLNGANGTEELGASSDVSTRSHTPGRSPRVEEPLGRGNGPESIKGTIVRLVDIDASRESSPAPSISSAADSSGDSDIPAHGVSLDRESVERRASTFQGRGRRRGRGHGRGRGRGRLPAR